MSNTTHTFPFPGHRLHLPDIVRAENCSLHDAEGHRWVDLESGVWCTVLGHGHPAVKRALHDQLDTIGHAGFCYSAASVERAAGVLLDLLGHIGGRCTFLCSGSEAVEYGVRAMRTAMPDTVILTMADSYFGAYGDAARRGQGWFCLDWTECRDCARDACDTGCPRWDALPLDTIGAFLLEPGSSSGMVRFPPARLVRALAAAVQERGGLVMANEVTTGMGRTGTWFGFEHYDIRPDVVALGKGIGNGYPVSVSSLGPSVLERLDGSPVPFGSSHFNDPAGAAVAEAVVATIRDEDLIGRAGDLSRMFLDGPDGLHALAAESPQVAEVRGRGLMAAVDLAMTPEASQAVHARLVDAGYVAGLRPGVATLRLDPALTIAEDDLRGFLGALRTTLATT